MLEKSGFQSRPETFSALPSILYLPCSPLPSLLVRTLSGNPLPFTIQFYLNVYGICLGEVPHKNREFKEKICQTGTGIGVGGFVTEDSRIGQAIWKHAVAVRGHMVGSLLLL